MRSYRFFGQAILVYCFLFLVLAACSPEQETVVSATLTTIPASSVTPLIEAATEVEPTPRPTVAAATTPMAAALTATIMPTPVPIPSATVTPRLANTHFASPIATEAEEIPRVSIIGTPIFDGGDVRLEGWSPDNRYLVYFEYSQEELGQSDLADHLEAEGTFTIYDATTGERCQRYDLSGVSPLIKPELKQRFTWLPNGHLFILTQDGKIFQTDTPCGNDEELTAIFPERILWIVNYSPEKNRLLLAGETAYWIYHLESRAAYPIAEIQPRVYDYAVWSPQSTYLAILMVDTTGTHGAATGGLRVVEPATGQIIAHHEVQPDFAAGGVSGAPVWLNEEELLMTFDPNQGPFFMTVSGQTRPLLPLFGLQPLEFPPDSAISAQVYVEPDSGTYHILWPAYQLGDRTIPVQIFHSATGTVEILNDIPIDASPSLLPDGTLRVTYNGVDGSWSRPIAAVGAPLQPPASP